MIRSAQAKDHAAILALNAESVQYLSALDAASLARLDAQAIYHRVVELDGEVAAFLLVLREGSDYASPNYRWFADHFDAFLYVDRVVVSAAHQGRGLGARLYDDLFAFARSNGATRITCEYDLAPPNPASATFHTRYGFREIATQWLGGGKQVSLQVAEVSGTPEFVAAKR